ncbi:MAG: GNAT family N-acetyltransferase [Stenomitos rutilans HA7619-LM2]|jgi:RimJ/RimL family protein N-acetyltransferase|nr:GNAT family N-acetyltransferase [Stenomitos rutilans HA7619-LM2]
MKLAVYQISIKQAREISAWRYEPPFSLYDLSEEDCSLLWEPTNRYYSVLDQKQALIGYCCFGKEARVAGGSYSEQEPAILDVGVGMHPDKTGSGLGSNFVDAVLQFGRVQFSPAKFRVTVAAFNERSLKTFYKLGFERACEFKRSQDGIKFMQLERLA